MRHGIVDGNNASTGICVMYEGSAKHVHGGLVEDVDAIHCQGCFSGYPQNGLTFRNVTCAQSWCEGTPERGLKKDGRFNYWQFGNNNVERVYGKHGVVEDSFYENNCPKAKLFWAADENQVDKFEVTEIDHYTPRESPA